MVRMYHMPAYSVHVGLAPAISVVKPNVDLDLDIIIKARNVVSYREA